MKKLTFILIGILFLSLTLTFFAYHRSVTFCNVNTMHTATSFGFTDDGRARVSISYLGYQNTTGATIHIKIEKQGYLFFRTTVADHYLTVEGEEYQEDLFYAIDKDGLYYCAVTYTVSGVGEDDIIVFKDEKTYRKHHDANQTEHTTETFLTETTATVSPETTESEATTTETTAAETTTAETVQTESAEEKALRARYEDAVKKMKSYQQKGSFVLNNKPLEGSDALAYLYGEWKAMKDYEKSNVYLSGFAIFPDMLTKITSVTYIEGDATVSQTIGSYTYDNKGRLVCATGQEMLDRYHISAEHEHRFVYNECGKIAYIDIFHQKDRFLMYRLWFEYGTYGDLIGIEVSDRRYMTYNLYGQLLEDKEDFSYTNGRTLTSYTYSYDGKNNVIRQTYHQDARTYGYFQLKQTVTQTYQHQYDENGYLIRTVEQKKDDFYRRYKFRGEEETENYKSDTTLTYIYQNDANGRPLTVEITDSTNPENKEILTFHYETIYTYR